MTYSRTDFLSDLTFLVVLGLLGCGIHRFIKSPMAKAWIARVQRQAPVANGTIVDKDWSIQAIDGGQTIPFSTLKGKVVFLNFWATWCGPCRLELPSIEKLYGQYKGTDVVFLCVSDEDPQLLKLFIQKENIHVPVYAVRRIPDFFHATALPATFIISRSGKVALSRVGASQWNKRDILRLIESLRAEKVE